MSKIASLLSALTVLAAAGTASADEGAELVPVPPGVSQPVSVQPSSPPSIWAEPVRDGFTIGFSLGAGRLTFAGDEVDGGTTGGLSLRLGSAVSQNFLVQFAIDGVRTSDQEDNGVQLSFMGVSLQPYLHPRVYLLIGAGIARVTGDVGGEIASATERAPGVLAGLGVEVLQTRGFALSLEGRMIAAQFEEGTSTGSCINLGFQWF